MADSSQRYLSFTAQDNYANGSSNSQSSAPSCPMYGSQQSQPQSSPPTPFITNASQVYSVESLDLSGFDAAVPESKIERMPMHTLIKPLHEGSWLPSSQNSHHQHPFPGASAPGWYGGSPSRATVLSDPTPHQQPYGDMSSENGTSDAGDVGYPNQMPQQHYAAIKPPPGPSIATINAPPWTPPPQSVVSDSGLHIAPREPRKGRSSKPPLSECTQCGRRPKNQSDANLTHSRPFMCTISNCSRKEGFATDNDLQRHRKSVHKIAPTVGSATGYVCAKCPPPEGGKAPKFWPRRDNFKAHIKRKHPECSEQELMEASMQEMYGDEFVVAPSARQSSCAASQTTSNERRPSGTVSGQHSAETFMRNPQHEDYNSMWPPASGGEFSRADSSLLGTMGHATMTEHPMTSTLEIQNLPESSEANSSSILSDVAFNQGLTCFMTTTPPPEPTRIRRHSATMGSADAPAAKRLRLGSSALLHESEPGVHEIGAQIGSNVGTVPGELHPGENVCGSQGELSCPHCGKPMPRECDFKKHLKRHTRPYGCTFPRCFKKFGSRNDWKRHESSQHYLSEIWLCRRHCADGSTCAHPPFLRMDHLKKHLLNKHGLSHASEVNAECAKYRLGRNANDHFWCGFCKEVIDQDKLTPYAYAKRFKHIGDHFDKDHAHIDNWVCIERHIPKGQIARDEYEPSRNEACDVWNNEDNEYGHSVIQSSHRVPQSSYDIAVPVSAPPGFS